MTGIRPYDRRAGFLFTDDLVKVIDYDGNEAIFIVQRHESIAQHSVKFTSRVANGGIPAGQKVFSDFRFLQPARENRLFEIRPMLFAVRQQPFAPPPLVGDGMLILPPSPSNIVPPGADPDRIPAGVELVWRDPAGMARGGTDLEYPAVVNITPPSTPGIVTTPSVGGVNGGYVEAIMVPLIDDFSDLYKMHAIYGHTIEFGIANRTDLFLPPATIGGIGDNKQYFVGIVGRKHILGPVSDELKRKVENEEVEYKAITIGGIPIVTTRA